MGRVLRLVLGVLAFAYGLVHLRFLGGEGDEGAPFAVGASWLVGDEPWARPATTALVGLAVVAFLVVGLAVAGLAWFGWAWPGMVAPAAIASLVLVILYWHEALLPMAVIDVALLVVALWWSGFADKGEA